MVSDRIQVCVVAYYALPVVDPAEPGAFGGSETRAWRIAQLLAARPEFEVSLIVRHHRRARVRERDGVRIVTRVERWFRLRRFVSDHVEIQNAPPWLRVRHWRWRLLWMLPWLAALRLVKRPERDPREPDPFFLRQGADVYLTFGANEVSASVAASARAAGRPAILFLGSDSDLDPRFAEGASYLNVYGQRGDVCLSPLLAAGVIVAQTPRQQRLLRQRFGREAQVIGNPIDVRDWRPAEPDGAGAAERYALWIGRADAFHKRPLLLLDLAEQCPAIPFLMLMNPGDREIAAEVRRRRPANVRIVEHVPFAQMPEILRGAFVFVSTSSAEYEGFPNVFLQAAACGVPIASWEVDPGWVREGDCGLVADGDAAAMKQYIEQVYHDPRQGQEAGRRGREYVRRRFDADTIGRQIAEVVRACATATPPSQDHSATAQPSS